MMKITYDKDADAAYIYLAEPSRKSKKTKEVKKHIILDFDEEGILIGVEVLYASKHLPKETLVKAEKLVV
ncbi:hypothetical protein COV16_01695 [Candidatus Woesearchaeota archaeon CG10_big_fil_rev_8_21_14_0_10_34_8]|nr:MAG: hypothetical protein COV16_01695 [Candidatus Woesearchaeota archaeon CG10_big_fil_rev_8_21_14_0_10_34_8]